MIIEDNFIQDFCSGYYRSLNRFEIWRLVKFSETGFLDGMNFLDNGRNWLNFEVNSFKTFSKIYSEITENCYLRQRWNMIERDIRIMWDRFSTWFWDSFEALRENIEKIAFRKVWKFFMRVKRFFWKLRILVEKRKWYKNEKFSAISKGMEDWDFFRIRVKYEKLETKAMELFPCLNKIMNMNKIEWKCILARYFWRNLILEIFWKVTWAHFHQRKKNFLIFENFI